MCLNNTNQTTACSELKTKTFRKSETADCWLKWETRHNAEQSKCITKFTIDDRQFHNDFQPFACIMTERFENTPKDQSNYYLRKENLKKCRDKTAQNKADKLLTSLQRYNQSKRQAKKIELNRNLTFTELFCNRKATDSQVNISLSMLKI